MNLNRTLAVLAGVATLCAVTAASPAVATTALVTAGIGLLGGLPVIDAREGRRKRFEDTQVTNAYRDIRQTSYEQQCCQSKSGHIYSNSQAFPLWETCKSLGDRRGEKLITVPAQPLNVPSVNIYAAGYKQCLSSKAAAKINESVSECLEKPLPPRPFDFPPSTNLEVRFNVSFDNEITGVISIGTHWIGDLNFDECNVSFSIVPEPPDEELFYDAVIDLPSVPESTKIIAGLSAVIGVGGVAAAVAGSVYGAKKIKEKCHTEEIVSDDKIEMFASVDAPPSYSQTMEEK